MRDGDDRRLIAACAEAVALATMGREGSSIWSAIVYHPDRMDLPALLNRIGYDGPTTPELAVLRQLHRAFLLSVPFENLDICAGKRIGLDEEAIFKKVVGQGRGGFCYEVNGLFSALLRELGFEQMLVSACVCDADEKVAPDFTHIAVVVRIADQRWLADVGFGELFAEPVSIETSEPQTINERHFRIVIDQDRYTLQQRINLRQWRSRYCFTTAPRQLADFIPMSEQIQNTPDSPFRRRRLVTRMTPRGRITLTDDKLRIDADLERTETLLTSEAAYQNALKRYFGIVIDRAAG